MSIIGKSLKQQNCFQLKSFRLSFCIDAIGLYPSQHVILYERVILTNILLCFLTQMYRYTIHARFFLESRAGFYEVQPDGLGRIPCSATRLLELRL